MSIRSRKLDDMAYRPRECRHCGKTHRRLTEEACLDRTMSEKTLQSRVVGRAKRRGWVVRHVGKGIAAFGEDNAPIFVSTAKDFPDLFMLHEGQERVLAIELKRELGVIEEGQLSFIRLLNACGVPAVVVRPSDLRSGRVDLILGE